MKRPKKRSTGPGIWVCSIKKKITRWPSHSHLRCRKVKGELYAPDKRQPTKSSSSSWTSQTAPATSSQLPFNIRKASQARQGISIMVYGAEGENRLDYKQVELYKHLKIRCNFAMNCWRYGMGKCQNLKPPEEIGPVRGRLLAVSSISLVDDYKKNFRWIKTMENTS